MGRLARALRFELNDLASQEAPLPASDAEVQARAFAAQAWVQLYARAQTPDTNLRATRLARSAVALAPTFDPATIGQLERLLQSLREAGLPEEKGSGPRYDSCIHHFTQ